MGLGWELHQRSDSDGESEKQNSVTRKRCCSNLFASINDEKLMKKVFFAGCLFWNAPNKTSSRPAMIRETWRVIDGKLVPNLDRATTAWLAPASFENWQTIYDERGSPTAYVKGGQSGSARVQPATTCIIKVICFFFYFRERSPWLQACFKSRGLCLLELVH